MFLSLQWDQFMKCGEDIENTEIEEGMKEQKPTDGALLIYTVSHHHYASSFHDDSCFQQGLIPRSHSFILGLNEALLPLLSS